MNDGIFTVTLEDGSIKEYRIVAIVNDEERYLYSVETNLLHEDAFLNNPTLSVFSLIEDGEDFIVAPVKNQVRALELEKEVLRTGLNELINK